MAYVENNYYEHCVITKRFKLVQEYKPNAMDYHQPVNHRNNVLGKTILFDLENDPYETRNLADDPAFQEEIKALRQRLFTYEDGLNQRRISHPETCKMIDTWSRAISKAWENIKL